MSDSAVIFEFVIMLATDITVGRGRVSHARAKSLRASGALGDVHNAAVGITHLNRGGVAVGCVQAEATCRREKVVDCDVHDDGRDVGQACPLRIRAGAVLKDGATTWEMSSPSAKEKNPGLRA